MNYESKVGDKVNILPFAVDGGVSQEDVGKIGEVTKYCSRGGYFYVIICDPTYKSFNSHLSWAVYSDQIELAVVKGQQLLFSFMGK